MNIYILLASLIATFAIGYNVGVLVTATRAIKALYENKNRKY